MNMRLPTHAPTRLYHLLYRPMGTPVDDLRTIQAVKSWQHTNPFQKAGLLIGSIVLWPMKLTMGAAIATLRWGDPVTIIHGKSLVKQFWEQLSVGIVYGMLPRRYYMFELYRHPQRIRANEFLQCHEAKAGFHSLIERLNQPEQAPLERRCKSLTMALNDKEAFHDHCVVQGLPVVPIIATVEQNQVFFGESRSTALPDQDLFIKPALERSDREPERWTYYGGGWSAVNPKAYQVTKRVVNGSELLTHVMSRARGERWIIQPRLKTHSFLSDLSNGALLTARLVSCRDERGFPEVTHAVFRMARGKNRTVDTFHKGGIVAGINIRSGSLGRASDLGLCNATIWHSKHPETGGQIEGRVLPFWKEAIRLALRAHGAFADHIIVGWDIAFAETGLYLVAGNSTPCLDILQRATLQPLGNSRLGELLAFHVRRSLLSASEQTDTEPNSAGLL